MSNLAVANDLGTSESPVSPLCPTEGVVIEKSFTAEQVIEKYSRYLGIDVREDLVESPNILLCRGRESNLRFFWPTSVAGSPRFYEKLMAKPHYYLPEKWEYDAALSAIPSHQRVLEVGCGTGDFLALLKSAGHQAIGIEINEKAIRVAVDSGRDVQRGRIEDFSSTCPQSFDAVCAFQVLEHISNPVSFIDSTLKCLRDGGLAIFAVPNGEGVFSTLDVALDMPPHHMLRWNSAAFQYLTKRFPIVLEDIRFEPISRLHLGLLATACFNDLALPQKGWNSIRRKLVGTLASKYWAAYFDELKVAGHTLFVVFRKIAGVESGAPGGVRQC